MAGNLPTKERLAEMLAKLRADKEAGRFGEAKPVFPQTQTANSGVAKSDTPYDTKPEPEPENLSAISKSLNIQYNEKQQEFVTLATTGKSCVLVGAAGTGKTTCMEGVATSLIESGIAGFIDCKDHKSIVDKSHGILIVAFTRRAVANIRKRMPNDLKKNCMTIHALLEFEPVRDEIFDETTGELKKTMEFLPMRNAGNPLPTSIHTIIIEESSMVSGTPFDSDKFLLFNRLKAALTHPVQFIYLGDIQQLPPVFGAAILGFKMLEHPVIELTEVYRQALESPIIRLAHRILSGKVIPVTEFPEWKVPDKLTLHNWKKKIKGDDALETIAAFFRKAIDSEVYNPDDDMILIPFNKACGTLELNRHIATHLAIKNNKLVHEVIAGYNTMYFAIGDKILVDKEDALVTAIKPNPLYAGKSYQEPATTMNYWGYNDEGYHKSEISLSDEAIDDLLELAASDSVDERVTQASHIIHYKRYGSDVEHTVSSAGDINAILHGYALTVHKSQGSEWRKVFCIFHQSHATMIARELLYTAVTRAKEELYVICEPETFVNGIRSQRIKGDTIQQKAEFFKGKLIDSTN